jgi:hypothetical protein
VEKILKEPSSAASDYPFGPYPKDKLIIQTDRTVEYQTPPHTEGLGTETSVLRATEYPINGIAILVGEEPDLVSLVVRLPPDMNGLTSPIIQQIERENAMSPTKK